MTDQRLLDIEDLVKKNQPTEEKSAEVNTAHVNKNENSSPNDIENNSNVQQEHEANAAAGDILLYFTEISRCLCGSFFLYYLNPNSCLRVPSGCHSGFIWKLRVARSSQLVGRCNSVWGRTSLFYFFNPSTDCLKKCIFCAFFAHNSRLATAARAVR